MFYTLMTQPRKRTAHLSYYSSHGVNAVSQSDAVRLIKLRLLDKGVCVQSKKILQLINKGDFLVN